MNHSAQIVDGWELHMVGGSLFITSEQDPDTQVALSRDTVLQLVDYLQTALDAEAEQASLVKVRGGEG